MVVLGLMSLFPVPWYDSFQHGEDGKIVVGMYSGLRRSGDFCKHLII